MISKYLTEEWYLLGQPWVDSEFAGMDILAGDEDPHRGTYLFSVDTTDDIDDDEAREIAAHLIDVHNRSLAEGNKLQHCWLDKLRAEQQRVEQLRSEVEQLRADRQWQPIATAPKDGREVLLKVKVRAGIPRGTLVGHYMPGGHCIEDHPAIAAGWYFWNGRMFDGPAEPIEWMELPE